MTLRTAIMAAAAAVLLSSPAGAARRGTIPIGPGFVSGNLAAPGTQTWRLDLQRGKFYAVWAAGRSSGATVVVRAAGGQVLADFPFFAEGGAHGASFRAPYTGSYTAVVTCPASAAPDCGGPYNISADRDCPGDRSTRCSIRVGRTLNNLQARFAEDHDWYRTSLRAGVTYVLSGRTAPGAATYLDLSLRDARGNVLASESFGDAVGCEPSCSDQPITFTPRVSGTYYVEAHPDDAALGTYNLSLSQAASTHR